MPRMRPILLCILLIALFLPNSSFGAVVVDTANIGQGITSTSTITWTHQTVNIPNRILIVAVALRGTSTVTGITYGNLAVPPTLQTLTNLGGQNNDANPQVRIELWYLLTPQVGNWPINVTLSSNSNAIGSSVNVSGVNITTNPADTFHFVGASAFQSAASTDAGGSNIPLLDVLSNTDDVIISSVATEGNAGAFSLFDPSQGFLWARFNGTNAAGVGQAGSYADGAASVTIRWDLQNAAKWAIGAVSVRPAVTISGVVFEDADFAGTASEYLSSPGDVGLPNVDVELYDAADAYQTTVTTAADGSYSFTGLANGTYKVRVLSATIGDNNTLPRGGRIGSGTWPDPLPELAWANGAPLYGGVSPTVDDTATNAAAGPGDTYTTVTLAGSNVPNVNFGFAYNLIVNVTDDNRNDNTRSTQGSLRQFIKNANAIGQANGTTASSSQFRMQVPPNYPAISPAWWRFAVANRDLPALSDNNSVLDGSTQRLNSGIDSNTLGPEIEITGISTGGTAIGLQLNGSSITVREIAVTYFSLNGVRIEGSNNFIEGCYIGIDATGTTAATIDEDGILIIGNGNTIGGSTAAQRNVLSGNADEGIDIDPGSNGNIVIGNYIGTNATATAAVPNGSLPQCGGIIVGGSNNRIGGTAAGEGNVISGNIDAGIRSGGSNTGTLVYGNFIGTTPAGLQLGNTGDGVSMEATAQDHVVGGTAAGQANVIAYNSGRGVFVSGAGSDRNAISGNSIFENGGLGIDLDGAGANNNKARPVLTAAAASGSDYIVTATVTNSDTIEFFRANNPASPAVTPDAAGGEGYLYLGRCVDNGICTGPYVSNVSDANGAAGTVQATLLSGGVATGDIVSATAYRAADGTSEFSANRIMPILLSLVKQAWLENGTSPLASPVAAPVGSTVVFLIYVKNTTASTATDVRITDLLDEAAFQYVPGSLVRTSAATPPADTATDLAIFAATAPGTGTALTDIASVADVASAVDTNASTFADRITVGAVTVQTNGSLSIPPNTTFAIRFRVIVR